MQSMNIHSCACAPSALPTVTDFWEICDTFLLKIGGRAQLKLLSGHGLQNRVHSLYPANIDVLAAHNVGCWMRK